MKPHTCAVAVNAFFVAEEVRVDLEGGLHGTFRVGVARDRRDRWVGEGNGLSLRRRFERWGLEKSPWAQRGSW